MHIQERAQMDVELREIQHNMKGYCMMVKRLEKSLPIQNMQNLMKNCRINTQNFCRSKFKIKCKYIIMENYCDIIQ